MKYMIYCCMFVFMCIGFMSGCSRVKKQNCILKNFIWAYSNHRPGVDYEYAELNFKDSIVIVHNSLQNEQYDVTYLDSSRMLWNGIEVPYSLNLRDTTLRTRLRTNEVLYKGVPKIGVEENFVVRMARDMIEFGPEGSLPPEVHEAYKTMIWNSYFPELAPIDSLASEIDID